jgi:DNA-directed RNA polymerase subunit RPC12/RpoP
VCKIRMGAAASFDLGSGSAVPSSTPFFCHACSETFVLTESTRRSDLRCPRCHSSCLEEFSDDRRWSGGGSNIPRASRPFHGLNFSENLTFEQSRRLLNASIMLRLLEAQLREELDSLQMAYSASLAQEAAKVKGLSPMMAKKLRRPTADVDMICSQPCCPICNDDFIVDVECLQMPCSHIFHEACVYPWLEGKRTCPICRYELNDACSTLEELQRYSKEELVDMINKNKRSSTNEISKSDNHSM